MLANSQVFDFHLSEAQMQLIDALNEDLRVGPNPNTFDFK